MIRPVLNREIAGPGGRTIHLHVFGDPSLARPVVYFHGFPGTGLEASLGAAAAAERGVSLVAWDRPGLGGSEFDPERTIVGTVECVERVVDELGIGRFGVIGVSGGTPYALAAAHRLSDRIDAVGIVSGMGPVDVRGTLRGMNLVNRGFLSFGRRHPRTCGKVVSMIAEVWRRKPRTAALWFTTLLPKVDRSIIRRSSISTAIQANLRHALEPGVRGVAREFHLLVHPWGFDLEDISCPVAVWHGTSDSYVPMAMAETFVDRIPRSSLRVVDNGGHFMIVDIAGEVLEWVLQTPARS